MTEDQNLLVMSSKTPLSKRNMELKSKSNTLGNPTYNTILERLHSVLGNLVRKYNLQGK